MSISSSCLSRSSVPLVKSIRLCIPALFTSRLRSLNSFSTHSYRALRSPSLDTSHCLTINEGSLLLASSSLSILLPQTITLFPSFTKDSASAKPIPVAPPVINTVLFFVINLIQVSLYAPLGGLLSFIVYRHLRTGSSLLRSEGVSQLGFKWARRDLNSRPLPPGISLVPVSHGLRYEPVALTELPASKH